MIFTDRTFLSSEIKITEAQMALTKTMIIYKCCNAVILTSNSKLMTQKTQKDKKLVPQNNKSKMQTQINPYRKNNDHTRIMRKNHGKHNFVAPLSAGVLKLAMFA